MLNSTFAGRLRPVSTMSSCSDEFQTVSAGLLDQSMAKIEHCLRQLNETQVWWRPEPTMNSIGNLLMHMEGNLRQWGVVPFTLAKDRRNRSGEFARDVQLPAQLLLENLQSAVSEAKEQWQHLSDDQLNRHITIQGFSVSHLHAIMHTSSHMVGHTHQIVQLTRLQLRGNYQFHWSPEEERGDVPV